ncbi:hypothetical protein J4Q44_G00017500 [Coregonus suidteri]|uniref:Uncharacterized protein n=1 Tax=Coregonus suidteri TaxID=861788 RepID=A0AAN8R5K6_9TELE
MEQVSTPSSAHTHQPEAASPAGTMSERGPRTEASMFFQVEVDRLERDDKEDNDEDKMAHYDDDKDDDDLMSPPSGSRVYDRTTVLIEQDPIRSG